MKTREISPARKGGLMYLDIYFVEELLRSLNKTIPEKVLKREKKLAGLIEGLQTCVNTHREDIRTGRGIVIGRDIQEVRYIRDPAHNQPTKPIKPTKKAKAKTKSKRR